MALIRDPFDDSVALSESGALAPKVSFVRNVADLRAPTTAELKDAEFIGWWDPNPSD